MPGKFSYIIPLSECAVSFRNSLALSPLLYFCVCMCDCIHPLTFGAKGEIHNEIPSGLPRDSLNSFWSEAMAFAGSSRLSGSWERLNRLQSKCRAERESFVVCVCPHAVADAIEYSACALCTPLKGILLQFNGKYLKINYNACNTCVSYGIMQ